MTRANQKFIEQVIQCRGTEFDFVKLGMKVEMGGEPGTIVGFNIRGNFDVKFANELKHDKNFRYLCVVYKKLN